MSKRPKREYSRRIKKWKVNLLEYGNPARAIYFDSIAQALNYCERQKEIFKSSTQFKGMDLTVPEQVEVL